MKPFMVSTGVSVAFTQAMSKAVRSASSPVRYHRTSAPSAAANAGVACGIAASMCRDDAGQFVAVAPAHAVHLFNEPAVPLHQARVERIALLEALEVGHRHAVIQVVGAVLQDVAAGRRRLAGHHRVDRGVEEARRQAVRQLARRLARAGVEPRPGPRRGVGGVAERRRAQAHDELPGGEVVVAAAVQPEELGVTPHLGARRPAPAPGRG